MSIYSEKNIIFNFKVFMRILIFFLIIIFELLFTACSSSSPEVQLLHRINHDFGKLQEQKRGLILYGEGSSWPDKIHQFLLRFIIVGDYNIDQARKLLIECVQDMIAVVNSNKQIVPYLNNYPINANNINLAILFNRCDGSQYNSPSIALVGIVDGHIYYAVWNKLTENFEDFYEEDYIKALQMLNE